MCRVVVGVDGSRPARGALAWALRYARLEGLPVTVVTVVDPLLATAVWDADSLNTRNAFVEAARAEAAEMVDELRLDPTVEHVAVDVMAVAGHPVKELVEAAKGASLLVVGSRGSGLFGRLLLGSTSSGVAHHAPCSVMIVRDTGLTELDTDRSG